MMRRQPEPEAMDLPEEAAAYARADFSEVNAAFVGRLLEIAGDCKTARAVDLGTGPGDIPIRVVQRRPQWHVTGVDVSAAMIAHARRAVAEAGLANQIHLVCQDAKALPFDDSVFDVVFSNSILHHVSDVAGFWAEVRRIAKPEARVLMRDLARPDSAEAAAVIVRQYAGQESALLQEEYYRSLLAAYTPSEVRTQLEAAGLGSLRVTMVSDRHLDVWGRVMEQYRISNP